MSVDYKWANAIMDQLKGCQAENARLREEAAAMTTALQKVEHLESEVARLRMTLQCIELAGEQRRVSGGKSPVEVKSSFISAKTLTAVLEALRSNWFFATDDDEDNNEEVIAATKMLEAEIADDQKRRTQGYSDEPCAYAIFEKREPRTVTFLREQAEVWMSANENCTVVPLYRSPTLTDEEREAVELAIDSMSGVEDISASWSERETAAIATLRGLLERLSPPAI